MGLRVEIGLVKSKVGERNLSTPVLNLRGDKRRFPTRSCSRRPVPSGGAIAVILIALTIAVCAPQGRASETTTHVQFTIAHGQSQPFITQIVVKTQGRIVLDITSTPRTIEVTLLLRRPDGTVASRISGKGGNLSLTYFATQQEVNESLKDGNLRWSVEISKAPDSNALSGRLKATHPAA
jgi:hypothetical protein